MYKINRLKDFFTMVFFFSFQLSFSPSCVMQGLDDYRCTACPRGYEGQYCERYAVMKPRDHLIKDHSRNVVIIFIIYFHFLQQFIYFPHLFFIFISVETFSEDSHLFPPYIYTHVCIYIKMCFGIHGQANIHFTPL